MAIGQQRTAGQEQQHSRQHPQDQRQNVRRRVPVSGVAVAAVGGVRGEGGHGERVDAGGVGPNIDADRLLAHEVELDALQLAGVPHKGGAGQLLQLADKAAATAPGVVGEAEDGEEGQDGQAPHGEAGQQVILQEQHLQWVVI